MKIAKKILKWVLYFLLIPLGYIVVSLILSAITIDRIASNEDLNKTIYLSTNGVHLDIVLLKKDIDVSLLSDLKHNSSDNYLAFGWGDEDFYINTPTWGDLTLGTAFNAMFLNSTTLMHVTRYGSARADWVKIEISETALQKLTTYLSNSFETNENGSKIMLKDKGYSFIDDFYKATGNYSCLKTCNTWVNQGLKESGLKSCFWTPFDFGLMNKYE